MKITDWLTANTKTLEAADVPTARLDCLVLLEDLLGKNKASILAHMNETLTSDQLSTLRTQVENRAKHIPLAFIRGRTEFYGREFIVTENVLEPRPESETMIDLLKKINKITTIIDVGTGSGALAITTALELPHAKTHAIDIDPKCLEVARKNDAKHRTSITFHQGDLVDPIPNKTLQGATLLANLPYVPNEYALNQAAMNEPRIAIFGGEDGLDLYRQLFEQISVKSRPSHILTESLPFQHQDLRSIALQHGYIQTTEDDFIQVFTASEQLQA